MLYLLTSHTTGRLASPLKSFVRYVLPAGSYRLVHKLPADLTSTDVVVGFTNPASNGLRKLKLDKEDIRIASKFNLRARLKAPGPIDDLRGTFWRSPLPGRPMCCVTWHSCAGLYVYRTLSARWLKIAHKMSKLGSVAEQDAMLHQWQSMVGDPASCEERLKKSNGLVAFDIETDYDGETASRITYFSIGDEFGSVSWKWTPIVQATVTAWLVQPSPKVAQNFVFDCPWLMKVCGLNDIAGPLHDTMAMSAEFCRQFPKSLQYLGAAYLTVGPWKTEFRSDTLDEALYNARDSEITYRVAKELFRLMPSLEAAGLESYYA